MPVHTSRRIILARHAKAAPHDADDHARPLAERGRRDASAAARWLADSGAAPDLVLCSTSARTRETWELMSAGLSPRPETVFEPRIYEAGLADLLDLVAGTPDDVRELVLVGHNLGMPALADALTGASDGDLLARLYQTGFPTSAIAVLTYSGSWAAIGPDAARLTDYWTPKD